MVSVDTSVIDLGPQPDSWSTWWHQVWRHRDVFLVLVSKDFQTRYKRASLGVAWAVVVPLLQAAVMAIVFSRVVRSGTGSGYPTYVMSGVIVFSYLGSSLTNGVISIVEGSSLTDKVWFPRVLLPLVPCASNIVGLGITMIVLVATMPAFKVPYTIRLLYLIPATLLLLAFCASLCLTLSALQVYFRDVKFLVQAGLMVWIYITPILYPINLLHRLTALIEANPLTGIVALFHLATVGPRDPLLVPLVVSSAVSAILLVIGCQTQRHYDRLFVDQL